MWIIFLEFKLYAKIFLSVYLSLNSERDRVYSFDDSSEPIIKLYSNYKKYQKQN